MKITTEAELERFVAKAAPGDVCEYHSGRLCCDRHHLDDKGEPHGSIPLHRLAFKVINLAKQGLLHLVQRRDGEDRYVYFAVRSSAPAVVLAKAA